MITFTQMKAGDLIVGGPGLFAPKEAVYEGGCYYLTVLEREMCWTDFRASCVYVYDTRRPKAGDRDIRFHRFVCEEIFDYDPNNTKEGMYVDGRTPPWKEYHTVDGDVWKLDMTKGWVRSE